MTIKKTGKSILSALFGREAEDLNIGDVELITFDVFDTLVIRSCGDPEAVFDIIGELASEEGLIPAGVNFREMRTAAEAEARRAVGANSEVTFAGIYSHMEMFNPEARGTLMELEMACELAICEPNNSIMSQYDEIRGNHRVAIISDTYLPAWFVEMILSKCGVEGYERLYVSSEYKTMKRNGKLFERMLNELNVLPGKVLHVGDHPLADWIVPEKMGLRSFLIRKTSSQCDTTDNIVSNLDESNAAGIAPGGFVSRNALKLKQNRFIRMLTFPAMNLRYFAGDVIYARSLDSRRIEALKGTHPGGRCFIIGNGPSLTSEDLEAIREEISFAANRIYKMFEKTTWRPTYYLAVDRDFIAEEYRRIPLLQAGNILVHRTVFSKRIKCSKNVTFLNAHAKRYSVNYASLERVDFSDTPEKVIYPGFTVTYVALQLALYMGFREIYLIGMDHSYSREVGPSGKTVIIDGVENHCYSENSKTIKSYQNRVGVEHAYSLAREEAEKRGARILNATRGGALEIFERVDLDEVLEEIADGK